MKKSHREGRSWRPRRNAVSQQYGVSSDLGLTWEGEVSRREQLNRPTLKGKCFTPKDGKWKSLSETSEVKRWRAMIFT
jgi:hypothetical protein